MPREPGPLVLRKVYDNQAFADALQLMLARMGENGKPLVENYPIPTRAHRDVDAKIKRYLVTGDRRHLIDAANYCVIEYLRPSHPKAYEEISREDS